MQALLLSGAPHFRWPRPTRRRWMFVSLAAGALMAGLLTFGLVATVTSLSNNTLKWVNAVRARLGRVADRDRHPLALLPGSLVFTAHNAGAGRGLASSGACTGCCWPAPGWRDALITVPVDVAVRKRTQCYCNEGTFFSMMIGITMIFWTFGPGVVLLFFQQSRLPTVRTSRRHLCTLRL